MRNDLPSMNPGKAMAQASHASNAFINSYKGREDVKEWQNQTQQGFGTVLVLSASIGEIYDVFKNVSFPKDYVFDPTYPYFAPNAEIASLVSEDFDTIPREYPDDPLKPVLLYRKETTCGYIFGEKDEVGPLVKHLKLHP